MPEFVELAQRKGKFYSKCLCVLERASKMHARLRPKVGSPTDFETQPQRQEQVEKERRYLTYNTGFKIEHVDTNISHRNRNPDLQRVTE